MKSDFPRIVVSLESRRRMVEIAREFRREPTQGEKILWNALRGKKLDGIKFRRQQPIGYFVVDFYSSVYRLVVLRIKSETVEKNLPMALALIRDSIQAINENKNQTFPSPYMRQGEGGG